MNVADDGRITGSLYSSPDGPAAVALGRRFGVPVSIKARGADVHFWGRQPATAAQVLAAGRAADGLLAVSAAMRDDMIALGMPGERIAVHHTGIDHSRFAPAPRAPAKAALGVTGPLVVSVGALIPRKGHHLTIAAMPGLAAFDLLIAGEGPERAHLQAQIASLGLTGRVRLLGAVPHADLPACYGAADAMVLASAREGWANVLLESMACGTPVVASNIPGNPEVVRSREAGLIAEANTPPGIAAAVRALFAAPPDRAATRAYAERFGWEETSRGQLDLFRRLLARTAPVSAAR